MIKSYFSVLCILIFLTQGLLASNGFTEIHSEEEWKSTLQNADSQNKLILVDFYTTWCGYCKKMDREVFANKDFQKELAENYVSIKLNAESPFGANFAQQNEVQGYPTFVIFNGSGNAVGTVEGYQALEEFRSSTREIHRYATRRKGYDQRFAKKQLSNVELGEYYTITKDATKRQEIYDRLMATVTDQELLAGDFGGFLKASSTDLDQRSTKVMLHNKQAFIDMYGEENFTGAAAQLFNNTLLTAMETENIELLSRMEKELLPYFIDNAEHLPNAVLVTHKIYHSGRSDWDSYQALIEKEWQANPQTDQIYREVYQLLEEFSHDAQALSLASKWMTPEAKANPSFENYLLLTIVEAVRENTELAFQYMSTAEQLAQTEEEKDRIKDLRSQLEEARE